MNGPGHQHEKPGPDTLTGKAAGVRGVVLTLQLDKPAQRQKVQCVEGLTPTQAQQPGREAEPELVYPDAKGLGRGKMSKLVDHYHHGQNPQEF